MSTQNNESSRKAIIRELEEGMKLTKCRQCGCMLETLKNLNAILAANEHNDFLILQHKTAEWVAQMNPIKYSCLGCKHCYPAVAMNQLQDAFPEFTRLASPGCTFEVLENTWPPVPGEYFVLGKDRDAPIAVSTLSDVELAEKLADLNPAGLCIVGKTETENIGIDKIIKNIITNTALKFLIVTGKEAEGHFSGQTLLALQKNGVDDRMRVIGSPGKRPILQNVTLQEVQAFREQVQVVDMIGCENPRQIADKIEEIQSIHSTADNCTSCSGEEKIISVPSAPVVRATATKKVEMDKAGYFVILPRQSDQQILVEHYDYHNRLLRTIQGKDARSIYLTIIRNGWVSQLSHAAYLGKELARAELSLKMGFKYIQDGA